MQKIVDHRAKGGNRGYESPGDRRRAVAMLRKQGFNYFVGYPDTQSWFALNYGFADWAKESIYVKDV